MVVYKAFKDNSLVQGGRQYRLRELATTTKPCILRVSGLHACSTLAAVKKYYKDYPVVVACSMSEDDIVDSHDGVIVTSALTPMEFVQCELASDPSLNQEDAERDRRNKVSNKASELADQLRDIAEQLEDVPF